MRQAIRRWWLPVFALAGLIVWATLPAVGQVGQVGARNGEWTTYGGDIANTRYAPLDQITRAISTSSRSRGGSRPRTSVRAPSKISSRRR